MSASRRRPQDTARAEGNGPSRASRTLALAGAETLLFVRNRTALVNSVLLPLLMVGAVPVLGLDVGSGALASMPITAVGVTLTFVTYYNLVVTFVARRESLVLQKMTTGELTGPEILLGTAAPTLLITLGQVALTCVGVAVLGGWTAPVSFPLPVIALLAGMALMAVLAAASSSATRTPEMAQVTTLPLMGASIGLSGLLFPLTVLPDGLASIARLLPLSPVVELAQLGWLGQTWDGRTVDDMAGAWSAAYLPLIVLLGWLGGGALLARRTFLWAPRR